MCVCVHVLALKFVCEKLVSRVSWVIGACVCVCVHAVKLVNHKFTYVYSVC